MLGEREYESARDIDDTLMEPAELELDDEIEIASRRAASLEEVRAGFMILDL